jgi:hypothetical protein
MHTSFFLAIWRIGSLWLGHGMGLGLFYLYHHCGPSDTPGQEHADRYAAV